MSGYRRADGGPHDPPPDSYRVEVAVCDTRNHTLALFSRSTLPGRESEGVTYEHGRLGATLDGEGEDWRQIRLRCNRCRCTVLVSRPRLEAQLTAMWAPYAVARVRVVWDSPARPR